MTHPYSIAILAGFIIIALSVQSAAAVETQGYTSVGNWSVSPSVIHALDAVNSSFVMEHDVDGCDGDSDTYSYRLYTDLENASWDYILSVNGNERVHTTVAGSSAITPVGGINVTRNDVITLDVHLAGTAPDVSVNTTIILEQIYQMNRDGHVGAGMGDYYGILPARDKDCQFLCHKISTASRSTGALINENREFTIAQINESAIPCLSYDLSSHSCDATESLNKKQILQIALKNSCIQEIINDGGKIIGVGTVYVPSTGPAKINEQKTSGGYAPGIFLKYKDSRVSFGVDTENQIVISQVVEALSDLPTQDLKCNYTAI